MALDFVRNLGSKLLVASPPGSLRVRAVGLVGKSHIGIYRLSRGRILGRWWGAPVLLLDTVGRKSGKQRTSPLIYLADGEDLVIVASRAGSDAPPAWWLNLRDRPETTVQVGGEKRRVKAREAVGAEKDRLWTALVEMYADFAAYQARTERQIPVVVLSRC